MHALARRMEETCVQDLLGICAKMVRSHGSSRERGLFSMSATHDDVCICICICICIKDRRVHDVRMLEKAS